MPRKAKPKNLETTLSEITSIVEQMERGETSLEKSLEYFERGVRLVREAQTALEQAEQKIQILLKKGDSEKLDDYGNAS